MATYPLSITESLLTNDLPTGIGEYSVALVEGVAAKLFMSGGYGLTVTVSAAINDVPSYHWSAGGIVVEKVGVGQVLKPTLKYGVTCAEGVGLGGRPFVSYQVTIQEGASFNDVIQAAYSLTMREGIRVGQSISSQGSYNIVAISTININDLLARGVGAVLTEGLRANDTFVNQYIALVNVISGFSVRADPNSYTHMLFSPSIEEGLTLDDVQLLKMIYNGQISENTNITVLYASPSGNYTSWAMNTRTNALTEYQNWRFNSFASNGRRFLGANEFGLYELNGPTDAGVNTIADIAGGYLELAEGKLAGLKGIYLGMSAQGNFYMNIVAGDGREYMYKFCAQPKLMTTKVVVGKGINARYLRWELISTGPDFDLMEIEFVPMMRHRRV